MGILSWLIIGLIAGVLAKLIMGDRFGWIVTIIIGIVGALVGGWLSSLIGGPGVSGINLLSILVATVGAIVVLLIVGLLRRV